MKVPSTTLKCNACGKPAITLLQLNIGDLALCKKHLDAHTRVIKRDLPPSTRHQLSPRTIAPSDGSGYTPNTTDEEPTRT